MGIWLQKDKQEPVTSMVVGRHAGWNRKLKAPASAASLKQREQTGSR